MRRTAAEAEATRKAILASARDQFAAHGFARTSTAAIVGEVGTTRGALYHHFADKTDLFRAVFVELEHELNDAVNRAASRARTAEQAFAAGCGALLDFAVRPDYRQIAVVDAPAVLGWTEWHAIDAAIGLASMQAGLDLLAAEGQLRRPPSPALTILAFGALTEAALALARGGSDGPSKQQLVDELLALVTGAGNSPRGSRRRRSR